jgi:hypothetical protein
VTQIRSPETAFVSEFVRSLYASIQLVLLLAPVASHLTRIILGKGRGAARSVIGKNGLFSAQKSGEVDKKLNNPMEKDKNLFFMF